MGNALLAEITKTYGRRNKTDKRQDSQLVPPKATQLIPLNQQVVTTAPTFDLDLTHELSKIKIPVSLQKLSRLPGQVDLIAKFLGVSSSIDPTDNNPKVFLGVNQVDDTPPFYISLIVNKLLLHNCMLDSSASKNVMTLNVMKVLRLTVTKPYHNVQAMDSQEVEVCGVVKNLEVRL